MENPAVDPLALKSAEDGEVSENNKPIFSAWQGGFRALWQFSKVFGECIAPVIPTKVGIQKTKSGSRLSPG